jgi:hypothetical protein
MEAISKMRARSPHLPARWETIVAKHHLRMRWGKQHARSYPLPLAFPRCSNIHKHASLVTPSSLK